MLLFLEIDKGGYHGYIPHGQVLKIIYTLLLEDTCRIALTIVVGREPSKSNDPPGVLLFLESKENIH